MHQVSGMVECKTSLGRGSHGFAAFHAAVGTRVPSEPAPLYNGLPHRNNAVRIGGARSGSGVAYVGTRQPHDRQLFDFPVYLKIAPMASTEVTTLMIRNLPRHIKLRDLVKEIDESGFAGRYDFVWCPRKFGERQHHGHAFVNFHSRVGAAAFEEQWHKSQRFGMYGGIRINITAAEIQGFHANVAKWGTAGRKADRIKSENCRPLILRDLTQAAATPRSAPSSPSANDLVDANSSGSSRPALRPTQQDTAPAELAAASFPTPYYTGR